MVGGEEGPCNVRLHNSTGKCEECKLQVGIVRDFKKHSFSGKTIYSTIALVLVMVRYDLQNTVIISSFPISHENR